MRIRRRPQAQALIPSPLHHPSDPSTAPPNQHHWLSGEEAADAEEESKSGELHRPNVDLADEPSQGNNVLGGRSSQNASGRGGGGAQRQGAQDGHGSLGNGHREQYQWPVISAGEERLVNGVVQAMPAPTAAVQHAKEGIKNDGPKRRRSAAVLLEGSRCSRVNGRGWRCSQPTLVGYSLCEHHLGKGRQSRSATNGGGGGGVRSAGGTKLGRTESAGSRKSAAAMSLVTVTVAPDATEPASAAAHLRSIHGTVQ